MTTKVARHIESCLKLCFYAAGGILLLGACALLPSTEDAEITTQAYDHVLTAGRTAIGDWHPVNLDSDDEEEHLLFFRYDSGQVGALIVEGDPVTSISEPEQLLPRYFSEHLFNDPGALGQGIIAPPDTPGMVITATQVSGNNPARELLIRGGDTHLTFTWWKGTRLGYGVTQLYAPGGFGVDWETWDDDPAPITSIMGYFPLDDYRARANICRVMQYTRRTDLPSEFPTIVFGVQPQGLHFCQSSIPNHPYAPEGVVLAYLLWPRADSAGLLHLLTPGTTLAQIDAESAAERWSLERIAEIAAYPSVPMAQGGTEQVLSPTTAVCVEFAERANPTLRRWLVYTLRYQPPDAQQRLAERWTVSGAVAEPVPMEPPPADYCATILSRNAP